jgi:hypothetical protein
MGQAQPFTYTTSGLYSFTVPAGGPYQINVNALGADGGAFGGTGATVAATFTVQSGDVLTLIIGQVGQTVRYLHSFYVQSGGGGGTAVVLNRSGVRTLLVAAGAGAGGSYNVALGSGGRAGTFTTAGGKVGQDVGIVSYGSAGGGGLGSAGGGDGGSVGGGGQATLTAMSPGGSAPADAVGSSASGGAGFGGGGGTSSAVLGGTGGGGGYGGGNGGWYNYPAGIVYSGEGGSSFINAQGSAPQRTDGTVGGSLQRDGQVILSFLGPLSSASAAFSSSLAYICPGGSSNVTGTVNARAPWTLFLSDGSVIQGTGSTFSLSITPTASTTITIQALLDANGVAPSGNITSFYQVLVRKLINHTLTGGGFLCQGTSLLVGLDGSQTDFTYQLFRNGSPMGNAVSGTGNAISFGNQTAVGTYRVQVTAPCPYSINGSTSVASPVVSLPTTITFTLGQPVSLSVPGFGEGFAYQWQVKTNTGFIDAVEQEPIFEQIDEIILLRGFTTPYAGTKSSALRVNTGSFYRGGDQVNGSIYRVVIRSASCTVTSSECLLTIPRPDLTMLLYALPSLLYSTTPISVIVDVVELNGVTSSGLITLKISQDDLLTLSLTSSATLVGGRPVTNSVWSLSGPTGGYYTLTTNQSIAAGKKLSVGLTGVVSPGSTKGSLTISGTLQGGSGSEQRITNNSDADKIDYFAQ